MEWTFNDGGRSKYFKGNTSDCVCRAIAIATGLDYKVVYDELNKRAKAYNTKVADKIARGKATKANMVSSRTGMVRVVYEPYLKELGWEWHSLNRIGSIKKTHLVAEELPNEKVIICQLTKHLVCVVNGVVNDTYNSSEKLYYNEIGELLTNDRRMVYGYYSKRK